MAPRPRNSRHTGAAGVSLIEALVALAVLSVGMVGVVGVQATLRQNADLAKQRSEAVRIAQEDIERWRAYAQMETDPAGERRAYADLAVTPAAGPGSEPVAGLTTNTEFRITRTVDEAPDGGRKALRVEVAWEDRAGRGQSITLHTHIARTDPSLVAGVVNALPFAMPQLRPLGRHGAIPAEARDLGSGRSGFVLPGGGGAPATTAWVFDNLTGMITGVCTVAAGTTNALLTAEQVAACRDNTLAHLLSGYVRFAAGAAAPTAAEAESPSGTARNLDIEVTIAGGRVPTCFDDAPLTAAQAAGRTFVTYYCAIPADATRSWAGYSTVVPLAFTGATGSAWTLPVSRPAPGSVFSHRLCRYTPATTDTQVVPNWQHPWKYRIEYADPGRQRQPLPMPPLTNQNFLVVPIAFGCPADGPANPAAGDLVNSNTLEHRPLE
jgi:hypothetical protein